MENTALRVLIVEDSEDDAILMVRELQHGGYDPIFERVDTVTAMQAMLDERTWDIVIADYKMPQFSGFAALELLQKRGLDLPFIIVSGTIGEDIAVNAMKAGAHDYVMKDNLTRLIPAVQRELREAQVRQKRQQAEVALGASEEKYRALTDDVLDSSAAGILILDADFRVVWVNQALERYLNLRRYEVIGQDQRQLVRHRIKNIFEKPEIFAKKVLATYDNNTYNENFECHVLPEGKRQERWLEHRSQPIRSGLYAGGRIEHYYGITKRKKAEIALDTHARQQAALFLISANLVATLDEADICQKVVQGLHDTLGYDHVGLFLLDEASGERVLCASTGLSDGPSDDIRLQPGQGLSERALLDGRPHYTPDVTREPDYFRGFQEGRSEVDVPLQAGGNVLGVLVVESKQTNAFNEDDFAVLTAAANQAAVALERARQHQAVKAAEIRYQTLFDRVPVGLYRTTRDGQILDANPALVEMLDYPNREALLAINSTELYIEDEDRRHWQTLIDQEGLVRNFETQMRQAGGTIIWVRDSTRAVRDETGAEVLYYEGSLEDITKHRAAEKALRESEERYRSLVETSPDAIALLNLNGDLIMTNQQGAFLFGYQSVEELLSNGKNAFDFIMPENQPRAVEHVQEILETGNVRNVEYNALRKDGTTFPAELSTSVIVDGDGQPQAFIGVTRDITERKQAEEEIHRRNRELTLLNRVIAASTTNLEPEIILETICHELALAFDLPQVVISLLNDEETLLMAASYNASGQTPVKDPVPIENIPVAQYLVTHKTHLVIDDFQNDPRTGSVCQFMGQDKVVSALALPFIIEGEVGGILGLQATEPRSFSPEEINLAQRVTDQVSGILARIRSDEERRLLSAAIEQTPESVIITDTEHKITYVNPAFEQVTGYRRAEAVGQRANILRSGKYDEAFYEEMWQTVSAGQTWHGHIINKKKDSTLYTDEATITPVRNKKGEIVHYVAVQRDVTRELGLEEQLRRSERMKAVGQLTAGIAHDFNNLLTAINGFAELMQFQLPPDSPAHQMASKILYSGQHAADLIRQLLAFSRKQIIQPKVLNLNTVVGNIDTMLRRIISETIKLEIILAPDLWPVEVDPAQIEQVIINLAVNARDAMPDGGTLIIETANVVLDEDYVGNHLGAQSGEHILLTVSDTGCGISKEMQAHIFEPFFTTKEVHEGTGLGLSTAYGIVKQSGGNIWVYSEEGMGATFKIYLPRVASTVSLPTETVQIGELPTGTETVLLVEDEPMVRELAAEVLREQGYLILEAEDGQEALRLAKAHPDEIHLLLTDVVMPRMGGKMLADKIKTVYPAIKTIFTSGYTDHTIMQHGVLASDITFMQKPFTPVTLARKVREVLDG